MKINKRIYLKAILLISAAVCLGGCGAKAEETTDVQETVIVQATAAVQETPERAGKNDFSG